MNPGKPSLTTMPAMLVLLVASCRTQSTLTPSRRKEPPAFSAKRRHRRRSNRQHLSGPIDEPLRLIQRALAPGDQVTWRACTARLGTTQSGTSNTMSYTSAPMTKMRGILRCLFLSMAGQFHCTMNSGEFRTSGKWQASAIAKKGSRECRPAVAELLMTRYCFTESSWGLIGITVWIPISASKLL